MCNQSQTEHHVLREINSNREVQFILSRLFNDFFTFRVHLRVTWACHPTPPPLVNDTLIPPSQKECLFNVSLFRLVPA